MLGEVVWALQASCSRVPERTKKNKGLAESLTSSLYDEKPIWKIHFANFYKWSTSWNTQMVLAVWLSKKILCNIIPSGWTDDNRGQCCVQATHERSTVEKIVLSILLSLTLNGSAIHARELNSSAHLSLHFQLCIISRLAIHIPTISTTSFRCKRFKNQLKMNVEVSICPLILEFMIWRFWEFKTFCHLQSRVSSSTASAEVTPLSSNGRKMLKQNHDAL